MRYVPGRGPGEAAGSRPSLQAVREQLSWDLGDMLSYLELPT